MSVRDEEEEEEESGAVRGECMNGEKGRHQHVVMSMAESIRLFGREKDDEAESTAVRDDQRGG